MCVCVLTFIVQIVCFLLGLFVCCVGVAERFEPGEEESLEYKILIPVFSTVYFFSQSGQNSDFLHTHIKSMLHISCHYF